MYLIICKIYIHDKRNDQLFINLLKPQTPIVSG